MSTRIKIFDTTLRDGEQSPGASMNVEEKVTLAKQLARLGVDIIEAGFAISSPGDFEAIKRIGAEVEGPVTCSLARAKKEDIDRAWEALRDAPKKRIHTFHSTSDIHLKHQYRISREEALKRSVEMVRHARSYVDDAEFSPMDATRTDVAYLLEVVEAVIAAGATTVNIPDTVGYAMPEEFGALIKEIKTRVKNIDKAAISVHCHNDLGLAVANVLSAIRNGATQVECTINGIGERAGNCSLEEVVMALRTRKTFFNADTGIHTGEIIRSSIVVSNVDPKTTFVKMVGVEHLSEDLAHKVERIKATGFEGLVHCALRGLPRYTSHPCASIGPCHIATAVICPSVDYYERAYDAAKYGRIPEDPVVSLTVHSAIDGSRAPDGFHTLRIWAQSLPYALSNGRSWETEREVLTQRLLDMICIYAPNIREIIQNWRTITPLDIENITGAPRGSGLHCDMTLNQMFSLRPAAGLANYRTPILGLYLTGAGTHPGGGLSTAPGYNTAHQLLLDLSSKTP